MICVYYPSIPSEQQQTNHRGRVDDQQPEMICSAPPLHNQYEEVCVPKRAH
jgi:hypothetical protein